jgi:alpha-beta hydrolase superfamily lysophospholipase
MKRWCGIVLFFVAALWASDPVWVPDDFLGEPFGVYPIESGEFHSTLVHYPFGDTLSPKAAVLYIHGFNDYFFQRELAEKMDFAGYSFYAIDLHKYGRSYRAGETLGGLRDISEYYAEIDSSIAIIRRAEGDSVPLVLLGHSTGGLIACLFLAEHQANKGVAALVLNSPFLEMNYPWIVCKVGAPILSAIGSILPDLPLPRSNNPNYSLSIHRSAYGEWDFDTTLKVLGSLSIDFGWLHAIHEGHSRIQQGLNLQVPILVMHSGCSFKDEEWSEEYEHCDGVLNVEHIREFGANLGPSVQLEEIDGAFHDVFLSHQPARDSAYSKTLRFLDSHL